MGIENTAADIVDDETLFSLNSLREKNYEDYVNNAEIPEDDSEDDLEMEPDMELEEEDKDRYLEEISKELEENYNLHPKFHKDRETYDKIKKSVLNKKAEEEIMLDKIIAERKKNNDQEYNKLLDEQLEISDSDSSEYEEPKKSINLDTASFFDNPIFSDVKTLPKEKATKRKREASIDDYMILDEIFITDKDDKPEIKNSVNTYKLDIPELPKTEKQLRHEKRVKRLEKEKLKAKKSKDDIVEVPISDMRIKEGMGKVLEEDNENNKIEIVSQDKNNEDFDYSSTSDSEEEEEEIEEEKKKLNYDPSINSSEYVEALALGSMMRKHSNAKELMDDAYNRYAFNDENLPSWFVEDEKKFNRKHLPIDPNIVKQIQQKYIDVTGGATAKVLEARARKKRKVERMKQKSKQKMEMIANDPDMSAMTKARQMNKLEKSTIKDKRKKIVVGQKSTAKAPGKKVGRKYKMVDKKTKMETRRDKKKVAGHLKNRNHGTKSRQKKRR